MGRVRTVFTRLHVRSASLAAAALVLGAWATACGDTNAALERLTEARHVSADLYVQFVRAAGATDRAVMADTDETSATFAREAADATQAIQHDVDALAPILRTLGYGDETALLDAFVGRFATYKELDRRILDLAVQNTNLKAQRLSFGPAQEAADAFQAALRQPLAPRRAADSWQVKALEAEAVAGVREIQALQAPHIADPDDGAMTRLEGRMKTAEASARGALASLGPLVTIDSAARLGKAVNELDHLLAVNAQIVRLSRQNTNVRSLALALDQKRTLTTPCEESLRGLRDALAKRGYPAGR